MAKKAVRHTAKFLGYNPTAFGYSLKFPNKLEITMLVLTDTETTGLPLPLGADLNKQPHIIEITACLIDETDNFKIVDEIDSLIKPPVPIPDYITRITGITNQMVKNKPPFSHFSTKIKKLFKRADTAVIQNFEFDRAMIAFEFERLNQKIKFPKNKFCTVEQSMHLIGRRMKLSELYYIITGKEITGAHRSKNDVMAMLKVYQYVTGGMANELD